MNKFILPILVAVFVLISSANAQQKIGFVNSTKIFQEIPEAKDAQRRLEAIAKPVQDEIEKKEKELQGKIDDYKKKEKLMNEEAKKVAQQEILELEQKYREYRADKLGPEGDLQKEQDKILNPVKEKILKAIEKVAKEERYSFVFDQTENIKVLLYGDAANDLTFKVIDKMKRGK